MLLHDTAHCSCHIELIVLICLISWPTSFLLFFLHTTYPLFWSAAVACSSRRSSCGGSFAHPQCRLLLHERGLFRPALWSVPWEIKRRHHGELYELTDTCISDSSMFTECNVFILFYPVSQIADQNIIIRIKGNTWNSFQSCSHSIVESGVLPVTFALGCVELDSRETYLILFWSCCLHAIHWQLSGLFQKVKCVVFLD